MPPQAGDVIEDFTLNDQDGNPVTLSSFDPKPVVLFFYPKADTPGCTIEACGFRDAIDKLKKAGVVVLGISRDTVKAQKKFAEKYDLNYPLLADHDQKICNYFDVIKQKTMYGKPVTGIERTTYLIGPGRKLLHIFPKVKPEGHAEEV
ncbi:thioredoxin-dependent thiol peroxidase, partial [Terriglobus sp. YAF25]